MVNSMVNCLPSMVPINSSFHFGWNLLWGSVFIVLGCYPSRLTGSHTVDDDFRDPDGVGIARPPPWQIAGVGGEPVELGGNQGFDFSSFQGVNLTGRAGLVNRVSSVACLVGGKYFSRRVAEFAAQGFSFSAKFACMLTLPLAAKDCGKKAGSNSRVFPIKLQRTGALL